MNEHEVLREREEQDAYHGDPREQGSTHPLAQRWPDTAPHRPCTCTLYCVGSWRLGEGYVYCREAGNPNAEE